MELRSLRCFLALAEHLNYSRAAESLYISQPTMSIRIRELEEELSTPLFNRSHHHVFLTNAGAALVPIARNILSAVDGIPSALLAASKEAPPVGNLRIGYDATEDRTNLQPLNLMLGAFKKAYPKSEIHVEAVLPEAYLDMLLNNELDMAIMVLLDGDTIPDEIMTIPIIRDSMVLATYHAEGMTLGEIIAERGISFLGDDLHQFWRDYYSAYLEQHISGSYKTELISDVNSLHFSLQYGGAVSFLPLSYLDTMSKDGLCIFETDLPDVILTLMWNKHIMNPAVQAMVNEANRICARKKKPPNYTTLSFPQTFSPTSK